MTHLHIQIHNAIKYAIFSENYRLDYAGDPQRLT